MHGQNASAPSRRDQYCLWSTAIQIVIYLLMILLSHRNYGSVCLSVFHFPFLIRLKSSSRLFVIKSGLSAIQSDSSHCMDISFPIKLSGQPQTWRRRQENSHRHSAMSVLPVQFALFPIMTPPLPIYLV